MRTGIGLAILLAAMCSLLPGCTLYDGCVTYLRSRSHSPDGALDAVVFDHGCGAHATLQTHVAVVPRGETPGERAARVFIASQQTDMDVLWTAGRELTIYLPNDAPVALQRTAAGDTRIRTVPGVRCGRGWRTGRPTPDQLARCSVPPT